MRKLFLSAGLLAVAGLSYPAASGAEFSFGTMPVAPNKQALVFNDGTKCSFNVSVSRSGKVATSNARYFCSNPKGAVRPLRIRIKNFAGVWLNGNRGTMNVKECTTLACSANAATYSNVPSGQKGTSNAIFDVYYPRSHSLGLPPPQCEYVKDPAGQGPPGHRITCALQDRK